MADLPPIIKQADEAMEGWPSTTLSILLIIAAIIVVIVAVKGPPVLKAAVLAWVVMP